MTFADQVELHASRLQRFRIPRSLAMYRFAAAEPFCSLFSFDGFREEEDFLRERRDVPLALLVERCDARFVRRLVRPEFADLVREPLLKVRRMSNCTAGLCWSIPCWITPAIAATSIWHGCYSSVGLSSRCGNGRPGFTPASARSSSFDIRRGGVAEGEPTSPGEALSAPSMPPFAFPSRAYT